MGYNPMDSTAGPLDPNIDPQLGQLMDTPLDPNIDPQLGQLMDTQLEIKSEPDEASTAPTGIADGLPDASSWPFDDCWNSIRPIEPTSWAPNAKLCDCPEHSETTWPAEHAVLVKLPSAWRFCLFTDTSPIQFIPDCAKRCPYCPWKTERLAKIGNPAPMLRRHIRQYHLKEHGDEFPGITVDPLRVSVRTEYVSYERTQGSRPKVDKNTEEA
ncbi:hypothetical protein PEX1_063120 [Penicillium expansum]|uniref:Zinc finger, C2H2 n=1 Tax=Penicillium expansum TaxID=27334 RepID=A0A0A2JKG4_PENEN|nr:hypothetical protein PEX2_089040 [Penicillium expansum]KGO39218.1 hypothetical protein PEXP_044880 [Penicillium expansum]KGO54873.1 hypothetical protein PEX2_089040 [Penicillium expansum]KGO55902.1 hypothetical protein PEX1_063120 [Penicillium expansum]